jgi:NAD(P)-dependent dehydrogenase (short-subunit alcohol dehydrogenase family)
MEMKGKVAVITGAGRGIGRALAIEFARHGASVVCCARTETDLNETASIIGQEDRCVAVPMDVSDKAQVQRMVDLTMSRFGRIDVLFNNAARIPVISGLWEVDADDWWEELTVNLRGPMLCCRAVLPHMMRANEGVIINMSGGINIPGRTSYCCSKVALNRMTELLARELDVAGSSVMAFGLSPGLVKTRRTLHEAESAEGIRWNPATNKAFSAGEDRPPQDCARVTLELLNRPRHELNGKMFSTPELFPRTA